MSSREERGVELASRVGSRHQVEHEVAELANFVKAVCALDLDEYVLEVFYDSVSSCCTFKLAEEDLMPSGAKEIIKQCALDTIGQFEWNGAIHHGAPMSAWAEGIVKPEVNDMSDAFDTRLAALQRAGAPTREVLAAINVYERTRTARSICQALLPDASAEAVALLVAAMGREVHAEQGSNSDE